MVCSQWHDKGILAPTGKIPEEIFKCIKWDFPDLSLPKKGNLPGESHITFTHDTVGNLFMYVFNLYLALEVKWIQDRVYMNDMNVSFFNSLKLKAQFITTFAQQNLPHNLSFAPDFADVGLYNIEQYVVEEGNVAVVLIYNMSWYT